MIPFLIMVGLGIWLARQYRGDNPAKWVQRKEALAPIVRHVWWDIQACTPRKKQRVYTDEEIRRMLDL